MGRANSHHKAHVQHDKPATPPPAETPPPAGSGGSPPAPAAEGLPRPWQTVIFLWCTAFVFLWAFELLSALFKAL